MMTSSVVSVVITPKNGEKKELHETVTKGDGLHYLSQLQIALKKVQVATNDCLTEMVGEEKSSITNNRGSGDQELNNSDEEGTCSTNPMPCGVSVCTQALIAELFKWFTNRK